jgi:hypothetical protein
MDGGAEQYDRYITELRNYMNMFKKEVLNSLEKSNPDDPNETHAIERFTKANAKIIHFGNALRHFFASNNSDLTQLTQFHNSVFDNSVSMPDYNMLKRNIPADIAIQYITNDTQANTTSFKK